MFGQMKRCRDFLHKEGASKLASNVADYSDHWVWRRSIWNSAITVLHNWCPRRQHRKFGLKLRLDSSFVHLKLMSESLVAL